MVQFLGQQYLCEHFKDVERNKTQGCGIVGLISSVTLGYAIRVKASWSMKQLLHVYVKAVKWICQSCSIYLALCQTKPSWTLDTLLIANNFWRMVIPRPGSDRDGNRLYGGWQQLASVRSLGATSTCRMLFQTKRRGPTALPRSVLQNGVLDGRALTMWWNLQPQFLQFKCYIAVFPPRTS